MGLWQWLHGRWPAGTVEKLPEIHDDGTTAVPGVRVVGDLSGIPLLKLAADGGARAIQAFAAEKFPRGQAGVVDVAIVGGGVSGLAAALECKKLGLGFTMFESAVPLSTLHSFPRHKPIFTYPTEMQPAGELKVSAPVKEALIEELESQRVAAGIEPVRARVERISRSGGELVVHLDGGEPVRAHRVLVAIGRAGNHRRLGVPGEERDKVSPRLFDPADFRDKDVLVVGGGDSAVESAVALSKAGARVILCVRTKQLARPKPENLDALAASKVTQMLGAKVDNIGADDVTIDGKTLPNDFVFTMIGREAPLDFFRKSGIPIRGERTWKWWLSFAAFFAVCLFVYNWKAGTTLNEWFKNHQYFPFNLKNVGPIPLSDPGFYYSFAYCVAIVLFGIRRIRTRKTPYIRAQTLTLMAIQIIPLFLLPYIVFPALGQAGFFSHGIGKVIGDHLFPDGSYWRSFGFILAWPLFVWNFFNGKPLDWWLAIGLVQTFVIIPLIVRRWGKGAYCGWICSCGALAETMGDMHRQKMPHGKLSNRLNMAGQVILWFCFALFAARIAGWYWPKSAIGHAALSFYNTLFYNHAVYDYYHSVDLFLAGVVGVGCYFWLSGRVWCRFFCPLAALMHIYARFSKFRIFADKKKCISCNVCTTVCHQGIDVMSFANKGQAMEDPECVRCSACVQSCPTGTLTFGRLDGKTPVYDKLAASPVQMREGKVSLRVVS